MATDTVLLETRIGPVGPMADGTTLGYPRAGRSGEVIVADGCAPYEEAASRGQIFCAANQANITFGTALTATAVTFTLYNPVGSLVDLVLLWVGVTVSAATTAGHLVLAANLTNSAAIPGTNTELTVRNAKLDGAAGYAKVYSVTTLPAAPVAIRTVGFVPVTATATTGSIFDNVNGAVVIGPNTAVTLQGITSAGTGIVSMFWKERVRLP